MSVVSTRPLDGIRVVELGSLIAGPFAGKTLADFGAEVIKIEPPVGGDPLRGWRAPEGETAVWWHVQSRDKKSVAVDLHQADGQNLVRRLAARADIVIENFRPCTMEGWNLGYEQLAALNPGLIMLRISGYGQTCPLRDLPGFGVIAEAMGGLRHITGTPGEPPVRPAISIGDSLSALHGVIGVLLALYHRATRGGQGQMIDVALFESVFNMMEGAVAEYDRYGLQREPAGSALPGVAPTNAYRCADGRYVLIAGNGDSIFKRLMRLIGRDDLGGDRSVATNAGRVKRMAEIDEAIGEWTRRQTLDDALRALADVRVPAGKPYTTRDIVEDAHYRARDMLRRLELPDGSALTVPGVVPKLSATPGNFSGGGPMLGADTDSVLQEIGVTAEELRALHARGVIA